MNPFDFGKILDAIKELFGLVFKIFKSITGFFEYIFSGQFFVDVFFATITIGVGFVIFLIDFIPSLPNLPENVYQNILTFFDFPFSSGAIGFIGWIFGGWTILSFVIITSLLIFALRISYDIFMFIITKLPVGVKRWVIL